MTRKEAERQTRQQEVLMALGFTQEEADKLRRISMTLRRWHELECGDGNGCIERDEATGKPVYVNAYRTGHRYPVADRETGALRRLKAIIDRCNMWRVGVLKDGKPDPDFGMLSSYIQGDPRGAALYILRPGDVPEGCAAESYYSRGVCVY